MLKNNFNSFADKSLNLQIHVLSINRGADSGPPRSTPNNRKHKSASIPINFGPRPQPGKNNNRTETYLSKYNFK